MTQTSTTNHTASLAPTDYSTTADVYSSSTDNSDFGMTNMVALPPEVLRADFNGDGLTDIALQNINDGSVAVWEMNGTSLKAPSSAAVVGDQGTAWKLEGSGDFYKNNISELLLQNTSTGQLAYWEVNAFTTPPVLATSLLLALDPGPTWHAITTGDFNGDGHADIAFQNDDSAVAIWEMNGANLLTPTSAAVLGNADPGWHLRATGDFYNDGTSDLAFQNDNGSLIIWGVTQTGASPTLDLSETSSLPPSLDPGPNWLLDGTGDFNADGHADFVFQNTTNGDVAIWEMNGASLLTPTSAAVVASPGTAWAVKSIGDYNNDGMSDILLQNTSSGQLAMWFMNGLTLLPASTVLTLNPGTSWTPMA